MNRDLLPFLVTGTMLVLFGIALSVVLGTSHPERRLLGQWKEVSWTYEKIDPTPLEVTTGSSLGEELRKEITKGLVIHESETWRFAPGSELILHKNGERNDTLQWKLKGHGHMLQLVFGDAHEEVYQVRDLREDEMVLQFNNDMIARGVVRIVLKRVTEHA
ncbi:MAG: hypothetical protein JNM62_04455 [Flavobacteriales bacterium]|nr:hypothetical protein [Flavobacteriales bacterium]